MNYKLGDDAVVRFAYARYLAPAQGVRDTLGDFVNQYAGYAQTTNTLGLATGVPRQVLANPYPAGVNPVIEPYGQSYGRYTNLGGLVGSTTSAPSASTSTSCGRRSTTGSTCRTRSGSGAASSPTSATSSTAGAAWAIDINLNMMDPAFRYEYKTLLNTQVTNPFRNYLTVDKFPGALRNTSTVTLGSLLKPYPQYQNIYQTNTNGKKSKTHTFEVRAQRPFVEGLSFLASYAYNNEQSPGVVRRPRHLQDRSTSGGKDGWEWRPVADVPVHRFTAALTWQIPVGQGPALRVDDADGSRLRRGRLAVLRSQPQLLRPSAALRDTTSSPATRSSTTPRATGGSTRACSRWPTRTRRAATRIYYDGLNGPGWSITDMTLTKMFRLNGNNRLEARFEAYNAFNQIIWDNPGPHARERELRQGHAQAGGRQRPRDPGRPAVHLLGQGSGIRVQESGIRNRIRDPRSRRGAGADDAPAHSLCTVEASSARR